MELEVLFKQLVWDAIVKLVISRLFAALPFLGWGPIGVVASYAVTLIADRLFKEIALFINLQLVVLKNNIHHAQFAAAAIDLRSIGLSKGIDSQEFKDARKVHIDRLADFVRFN